MRLFPFALLMVFVGSACGSSKKNEISPPDSLAPQEGNHRLAIAVTVDGNLQEWPAPLPGYSKETALHFGLTNNNDFLFIAVACSEDQVQRKLLRTGMEIYISESGKKQTTTGIEFPLPSARVDRQPQAGNERGTGGQNFGSVKNTEFTSLRTFGFKRSGDSTYSLSNANGINVAYNWGDNNFLNIEYAIPLKELFADVRAARTSNISIGFKLNGFGNRENGRSSGSYGGGRGGGMRGGGAGMRGGGMRGGAMRGGGMRSGGEANQGMNGNTDLTKDQSFWTKYILSPAIE